MNLASPHKATVIVPSNRSPVQASPHTGVRWGERFEVIYNANGKLVSQTSTYDPALSHLSFGVESAIYSDAELDLTLLPQHVRGPQTPVSPAELKQISADIETALQRKECADFLKALLDEAAIMTGQPYRDIMVTFHNVTFTYGNTGATGGRAYGSFEHRNASAVINPFESNFISEDRSAFIRTQTALNFFGETLHYVGTHNAYTDGALANAYNAILVREGKDSKRTFSDRTDADVINASNYWHPIQYARCKMRYK